MICKSCITFSVCHNAFEKMDRAEDEIPDFKDERKNVFRDIKQFLMMTLTYFEEMETKWNFLPHVLAANRGPLIESLCLLHALYGYPADPSTGNILIERSKIM